MRAGGRPKRLSNGARWVTARGTGKRKAKKENQEIKSDKGVYDSDGDGKTDFLGWVYYAPTPECPTWLARVIVIVIIAYICLKYS